MHSFSLTKLFFIFVILRKEKSQTCRFMSSLTLGPLRTPCFLFSQSLSSLKSLTVKPFVGRLAKFRFRRCPSANVTWHARALFFCRIKCGRTYARQTFLQGAWEITFHYTLLPKGYKEIFRSLSKLKVVYYNYCARHDQNNCPRSNK